MPSDSNFAIAMRTQQQAERAEQQRIKNLVLNYDLTDDQNDGEDNSFHYVMSPTSKRTRLVGTGSLNRSHKPVYTAGGQSQHSTTRDNTTENERASSGPLSTSTDDRKDSLTDVAGTFDTLNGGQPRGDKSGNTRSKQRARKLQLGDIDWYGNRSTPAAPGVPPPAQTSSLDEYIVDKKAKRGPGNRRTQRAERTTG